MTAMEPLDLGGIRRLVAVRYGSIHAFAKGRPGGVARSTIYQVLSGKYGGNADRQLARITAALNAPDDGVFEALKQVACRRCRKKRRRSRQCEKCFELWREQEKAVMDALGGRSEHGKAKQDRPDHSADPERVAGL
jgi:hypothetical protein